MNQNVIIRFFRGSFPFFSLVENFHFLELLFQLLFFSHSPVREYLVKFNLFLNYFHAENFDVFHIEKMHVI